VRFVGRIAAAERGLLVRGGAGIVFLIEIHTAADLPARH